MITTSNKKRGLPFRVRFLFYLLTMVLTKTSISDIVNQAGVAKGTFYLYFKDKYDIRNHLISHKASQVFQIAYNDLLKHESITDFEEQVLFIIDNILDQLAANHNLVKLLSKHLSWGFFKKFFVFLHRAKIFRLFILYMKIYWKNPPIPIAHQRL